jgi:hypothetical protein
MSNLPAFKCQYCAKETKPQIDFSGEVPTGMLQLCDCSQARASWEAEHRARIERQKTLRRSTVHARSLVHTGRSPTTTVKPRQRSR